MIISGNMLSLRGPCPGHLSGCLFVCLLGVTSAIAAETPRASPSPESPRATTAIQIDTVDGTLEGIAEDLSYEARKKAILLAESATPLETIVLLRFPPRRVDHATTRILLHNGEEIAVTLQDGDESRVRFRSPLITDSREGSLPLSVDIEAVHAIAIPEHFPDPSRYLRFTRSLPGSARSPITVSPAEPLKTSDSGAPVKDTGVTASSDKDIVLTREGSTIDGLLNKVKADGLDFEADGLGTIQLAFAKIRAVTLALLDDGPPAKQGGGLEVAVTFQDGSYLIGTLMALDRNGITMRSRHLGEVHAALEHLRFISVQGGRSVFLSDLDPVEVHHASPFFAPFPVRRDANVLGGPLRIRDRVYRKGLGMHAKTRLEYRLGGDFARFQAILGMDDAARPTSLQAESFGGGRAVFVISLDGTVVFRKELSYQDAPLSVDIPLAGKGLLSLEVDDGQGFIILDRADWAEARLIRK